MALIEKLLGAARHAALAGGLSRLMTIHIQVGKDSGIDPWILAADIEGRFEGQLLGECQVVPEAAEGSQVELVAVEGEQLPADDS